MWQLDGVLRVNSICNYSFQQTLLAAIIISLFGAAPSHGEAFLAFFFFTLAVLNINLPTIYFLFAILEEAGVDAVPEMIFFGLFQNLIYNARARLLLRHIGNVHLELFLEGILFKLILELAAILVVL